MSEGYNFVAQFVEGKDPEAVEHIVTLASMGIVAVGLILTGFIARASISRQHLSPERGLSLRNFFELIAEFVMKLSDSTMGKENRRYLPFICTLFTFVLFMDLLGLIPGMVMPTHKITINAGIAIIVFVCYNFWGIREVGIVNYLKHLWGPVFFVGFLLFPIEIISHFIRPLSLSLRLFGNMTGDHMVLGVFTDLTQRLGAYTGWLYIPLPVVFYFLGTLVCCIQAYIFALLTMIYIKLATAHEEHHEHH